jgi:hypothetical protein
VPVVADAAPAGGRSAAGDQHRRGRRDRREGAARRFNLDFYCKAFGIESPKSEGVSGMDVPDLLREGRHREIADYCLRDVEATVRLYEIWRDRLAGIK